MANHRITETEQNHIDNINIMLNSTEENVVSDYHIIRWARWIRSEHGINTITSYSEGFSWQNKTNHSKEWNTKFDHGDFHNS